MRNKIYCGLASSLLLMTPAIGSTGDQYIDGKEPVILLTIHGPLKKQIDWKKWERRGERVQKIGGGILVIIQLAAYIALLKR